MTAAILTAKTDREAWLEARRGYLGGTDIAAIVGKHKYKTALDVYLEKIGKPNLDEKQSRMAQSGLALEPLIREWSVREFGWNITTSTTLFHSEYPFIAVNPDGDIPDGDACWECKTYGFTTKNEWGIEGTDEVPDSYYIQAIIQCGIAGRARTLVTACDRGTFNLTPYQVDADKRNFDLLIEAAVRFQKDHIEPRIPPAMTDRDAANVARLYPKDNGEILVAEPAQDAIAMRMKELRETYKPLEKEYETLADRMKIAIGPAAGIETIAGKFVLSSCEGKVSWKAVAEELGATPADAERHRGAPFRKLNTPFRGEK